MEQSSLNPGVAGNQPDTELLSPSLDLGQAMPAPGRSSTAPAGRVLLRAFAVLFALLVLAALASAAYIASLAVSAPSLEVDLPDGVQDLSPSTGIAVAAGGFSLNLQSITLYEKRISPEGRVVSEEWIPLQIQGTNSGWLRTEQQGQLVRADGGDLLSLDGQYELSVTGNALQLNWSGLQQIPLSQRVQFATAITAHPLLSDTPIVASIEDVISFKWNVPLRDFSYTISPPAGISAWVDQQDPRVSHMRFNEYKQAQSYEIALTGAIDGRGVDWPQSHTLSVATTAPLAVTEESPQNEAMLVSREVQPEIVFSENVTNRDRMLGALRIEPEVDGHFEWSAPNRVRFVPDDTLPAATRFVITVQAGSENLRGQNGGYLEDEHVLSFTTERGKVIDVDLARQVMTLLINDQPVWYGRTATGVRGAETPPGTYAVQYKLPTARFRGTNPDGSRYDIPDVPWVMGLFDDYTIHGAYWRSVFGRPGSNGCISLNVADSKLVYDWTPVGTPVVVHY
ncbi:MAG: hypothetical protein EPO21_23000 [Chloroflexota bacterium]|nr:MAG: hypothetical protein EPO21_23000 [Chloroflexota bacterium]